MKLPNFWLQLVSKSQELKCLLLIFLESGSNSWLSQFPPSWVHVGGQCVKVWVATYGHHGNSLFDPMHSALAAREPAVVGTHRLLQNGGMCDFKRTVSCSGGKETSVAV